MREDVLSKLTEYDYTIFSKNMELRYLGYPLAEFDIVCMNFILDIKTTTFNNSSNRTINLLQTHNLVPEGYKYVVYSPLSTDDEVKQLKEIYTNPSILFITTLETIKEIIPPIKNIECTTTRDLANLMMVTDDEMEKINKIYVPYDIYKRHYDTITRLRDIPGFNVNLLTTKVNTIDRLIKENKLVFDKSDLEYVYPFRSGTNTSKLYLSNLDKITLNPAYYKCNFKKNDIHNQSYPYIHIKRAPLDI